MSRYNLLSISVLSALHDYVFTTKRFIRFISPSSVDTEHIASADEAAPTGLGGCSGTKSKGKEEESFLDMKRGTDAYLNVCPQSSITLGICKSFSMCN